MNNLRWSVYKVKGKWAWRIVYQSRLYLSGGYLGRKEAEDDMSSVLETITSTTVDK